VENPRPRPQYEIEDSWKTLMPVIMRTLKKDMDRRCMEEMEQYGLSKIHLGYLMVLGSGKTTMKSLSESLNLDKSNTTRVIADLRSKGLVVDDRTKENSKKYNIFLTEEGMELTSVLKSKVDTAFEEYLTDIPREEIVSMMDTLRKICNNMDPEGRAFEGEMECCVQKKSKG